MNRRLTAIGLAAALLTGSPALAGKPEEIDPAMDMVH